MTKTQVTALRKKLKAAVAVQKKKGLVLRVGCTVYAPRANPPLCCLLGAVIGQENFGIYSGVAATILKISQKDAMQVEAGFMGWTDARGRDPVLYDLGAEFRP